jgi:hypothetical protein
MKRGLSLLVEVASIALSIYGFSTAAYWYWVFLKTPATIQSSGDIVLQGVPLEHIIGSLFTTALGGLVHALGSVFQDDITKLDDRLRALFKLNPR